MHSQNSPTKVQAAERRTQALELRKAGATYVAIGTALGVSEQRAHRIITAELRRLNARRAEAANEVTRMELERLDALMLAVWQRAKKGELSAVDRVLSIMARRARLLGLDAPEKRELSGKDGQALRFTLEDAVAAEQELEAWRNERQQNPEPGAAAPGGA